MYKTINCLIITVIATLCLAGLALAGVEPFYKGAWGISSAAIKAMEVNNELVFECWQKDDHNNIYLTLKYRKNFFGYMGETSYDFKNDRLFSIGVDFTSMGIFRINKARAITLHALMTTAVANSMGPARYNALERFTNLDEKVYVRRMFITDGDTQALLNSAHFVANESLMFFYHAWDPWTPENLSSMEIFDNMKADGRLQSTTKGLPLPVQEDWLYE